MGGDGSVKCTATIKFRAARRAAEDGLGVVCAEALVPETAMLPTLHRSALVAECCARSGSLLH